MADEITVNFRFDVINGTYRPGAINISGLQIDQSAAGEVGGITTVTTSDNVTLNKTGLTDPGLLFMRNVETSTANVITWGFSTGTMLGELRAEEFAFIRTTTGGDVFAKQTGGTGGAKLHYRWLED